MAKKRASLPADESEYSPSDTSPRKKQKRSRNKISPEVTDNTEYETPTKNTKRNRSYKSSPKSVLGSENEDDVTVTEASLSLRFESPTNYKQIIHTSSTDTCKEELEDDDIELWLCKIPADMDVQKLNGQKVNLCGSINIKETKETKYNKTTELIYEKAQDNKDLSPLTVLTMSKTDGQLHPVNKKIEGFLLLRELPVVEPYLLPPCKPRVKKQLPEGLKQRYQPFGSDMPVISSVTHKKKKRKSKQH